MLIRYRPPTKADMNRGIMPNGVPPTLAQIKKGARYPGKPYTIHESHLMKKYKTNDLKSAREFEKEHIKLKREKDKLSKFL